MKAESTECGCLLALVVAVITGFILGPIGGIVVGLCAGFVHMDWAAKEFQKRLKK